MTCKSGKGDGFTFFQCDDIGELHPMSHKEITGKERLEPYYEDECEHRKTFTHKGVLKCQDCPAVYNEDMMEWEDE